ncbi:MAG: response regulator [Desulfobacterales bacterium]|nr:response regulator [Desulfobacterales bacterium]
MDATLLVIDDDKNSRTLVADALHRFGYRLDVAESVKPALELLKTRQYDIIITDKNMPDTENSNEGGMKILKYTKEHLPNTEVIMMTGYASIETVVEAMKLGAFDYITKPFSINDLKLKIERIVEYKQFINPDNTIHIYKTFHNEILYLLENRGSLSDDELYKHLQQIDSKIDHFFRAQKEWERIVLLQRELLGRIGINAECMKEMMDHSEKGYDLIEKICEDAGKQL